MIICAGQYGSSLTHAWLELEPRGQKNPAVQGPLQPAVLSLSAQPNRPAGHNARTPSRQKDPLGQGRVLLRVLAAGPVVYSPGTATAGTPLPIGQYTLALPQGCCVPTIAPPSQ